MTSNNPPTSVWPKSPNPQLDELFSRLNTRQVSPGQVAAFIANLVGAPTPRAEGDNVPGIDYLNRVVSAAMLALTGQQEAMNGAWADAKRGTFGFGSAMRSWANLTESWFGVFVEAANGPGYIPRPVWVYFDYTETKDNKKKPKQKKSVWTPDALKAAAKMDRSASPETQPDPTAFLNLDGGGTPIADLYKQNGVVLQGREIVIVLDTARAQKLPTGHYVSFIFAKGRSSEAPLAIVVLRVTRA